MGITAPIDPLRVDQLVALTERLLSLESTDEDAPHAPRLAHALLHLLRLDGVTIWLDRDGTRSCVAHVGLECTDEPTLHVVVAPCVVRTFHVTLRGVSRSPFGDADRALLSVAARLCAIALHNQACWQSLRATARLRSDTLGTIAHDLRSPLNALIGYAQLLCEDAFGPLTAEQRDVLQTMHRQAKELNDLLSSTLDLVRLDTGRLPVRRDEFSLERLVDDLRAGTFAAPTAAHTLGWNLGRGLPVLHTDRAKVKQILQNLIDNALKHRDGKPVEVEARHVADREAVRISVRDRGAGIPAGVLSTLFEPFRAGDSDGVGFGLYIVGRFSAALGGQVLVDTSPEGTTMTLEMPIDCRSTPVTTGS